MNESDKSVPAARKRVLLVGYKAADLTAADFTDDVTCHVLDIYHAHAIEKVHRVSAVCSPHLPDGPWDVIRFRTGPKIMSGELALDLLQECARLLDGRLKAPRFTLDFVGRERDRNDLLAKVRDNPKRVRSFRAEWPASVPGGAVRTFVSYPGCFCHRRLDEGGLALAEIVSRELLEGTEPVTLLDMGCGAGLVGLLIADRLRETRPVRLTMVDSHSRAVEAARENAARLDIDAEVLLADDGIPATMNGIFDAFVGNPPYYSDYRIADVFLETAARALKPGGTCWTVCKNAAGLQPVQERHFPAVTCVPRRGYCVLESVRGSDADASLAKHRT